MIMWETRKLIPEKSYKQTRHCIFVLMLFSYLIIFWFNQPIRNAHLSIFLWPYVVYCVDAVGMTNLNLKHSLSLFCQRGSVWQFSFILITGGKGTWVPKLHIVLFAYIFTQDFPISSLFLQRLSAGESGFSIRHVRLYFHSADYNIYVTFLGFLAEL